MRCFLFGQNHAQLFEGISNEKLLEFIKKDINQIIKLMQSHSDTDNFASKHTVATNDSITFFFVIYNFDKTEHQNDYFVESTLLDSFVRSLFDLGDYSSVIPESVFSKEEPEKEVSSKLSRYDKVFLRTLYSDKLWHRMDRLDASSFSMIEIWNELSVYHYDKPQTKEGE